MKKGILAITLILLACASYGSTESITVSELNNALSEALNRQSEVGALIGDRVETALSNANIQLDEDGLIYTIEDHNSRRLRGGCSANIKLNSVFGTVRFDGDSRFNLTMEALSKPVIVSADVYASVDATGKITARYGTKVLGHCVKYQKDHVTVNASADVSFNLSLVIMLNPVLVDSQTVRITPKVYLNGGVHKISNKNISIRGFDWAGSYIIGGVFGGLINNQIAAYGASVGESYMTVENANGFMRDFLVTQTASLQQQVEQSLGGKSRDYRLPNMTIEQVQDVASIVNRQFISRIPIAWDYIEEVKESVLFYSLTGDKEQLATLLGASACRATLDAQPTMAKAQLYRVKNGACSVENNPAVAGQRYLDSQCSNAISFSNTSHSEFCSTIEDKEWLGNADPNVSGYEGKSPWTLVPSTKLNLSVVSSISGNSQPYVQKVKYRTIENVIDGYDAVVDWNQWFWDGWGGYGGPIEDYTTYVPIPRGTGTCELEMRVYKKDIGQTQLKPLLAVHGGAWRFRGAGFYGMESQISQFTEDGFVVFAPFYRLTGEADGSRECNGVSGKQIVEDVSAAFKWVQSNMASYGVASGEKLRVFGQSAGANLAAWLMTYHQCDIDAGVLMYPPTDAADYIEAYQEFAAGLPVEPDYYGRLTELGYSSLESVLQSDGDVYQTLEEMPLDNDYVQHFTFPSKIAENSGAYPPAFMIHGRQDSLVPSVQSVRLCNAYAGSPDYGPAMNDGGTYRKIYQCGQSHLHVLQEADHMLELCLPPLKCEAGESQGARDAAKSSLASARSFLKTAKASNYACTNTIEPGADSISIDEPEPEEELKSVVINVSSSMGQGNILVNGAQACSVSYTDSNFVCEYLVDGDYADVGFSGSSGIVHFFSGCGSSNSSSCQLNLTSPETEVGLSIINLYYVTP